MTDALDTLRSRMAALAQARTAYEIAEAAFADARDALGVAISAAQEASTVALAAALETAT